MTVEDPNHAGDVSNFWFQGLEDYQQETNAVFQSEMESPLCVPNDRIEDIPPLSSISFDDLMYPNSFRKNRKNEIEDRDDKLPFDGKKILTKRARSKRVSGGNWRLRSPISIGGRGYALENQISEKENWKNGFVRRCRHCETEETPQWRMGPLGPKTLCNACGVRYKTGRLVPEYRPVASPTFNGEMHSNSHKKIMKMRNARPFV